MGYHPRWHCWLRLHHDWHRIDDLVRCAECGKWKRLRERAQR